MKVIKSARYTGSESLDTITDGYDVIVTPSLTRFYDAPEVADNWRHLQEWRHLGVETKTRNPVPTFERTKGLLGESLKEIAKDFVEEMGERGMKWRILRSSCY